MLHMLKTYFDNTYRYDEDGATLVEYALLVALIAIAVITAIVALQGGISEIFTETGTRLSDQAETVN